jgi:AcrR family transcriptional regulator
MCPKVTADYKSEVREKIIESAIECFAKTGFDRTKMEDIANIAGVSKGTLYLYFRSKEDLFYGICQNNLEKIKGQLNDILVTKENLVSDAERFYNYFQKDINSRQNIV